MPFSLPCDTGCTACATAATSVSRMPGLTAAKAARMAPSCIARGALDQFHFFGALEDLDAVDQVGGVDVARLGEFALHVSRPSRRTSDRSPTKPMVAVGERLQRLAGEFRDRKCLV